MKTRAPYAMLVAALLLAATTHAAEMTIFKQPNFTGAQLTLRGYVPNLTNMGFQDQASSIVVSSGRWEVCTQPDFRGDCVTLERGRYPTLDRRLNHRIESVREVGTYAQQTGPYSRYGQGSIELYGQPGFRGQVARLERDTPTLQGTGIDDRASSVVVKDGTWELCSDPGFRGNCRVFAPGRYGNLGRDLSERVSSARVVRDHRQAPVVLSGGISVPLSPAAPVPNFTPNVDIEIFRGANFENGGYATRRDMSQLDAEFDDKTSSAIVAAGQWELCTERDYGGRCVVFGPGRYPNLGGLNNQVSSLRRIR